MNKLTAIKIKYKDGTYSDEIPVGVLSENVEWDDTHTLVDVLGSIDVKVTGTIQDQISQLFNEKVSATQLQNYVASQLNEDVSTWLNTYVNPVGSAVIVDSSLTVEGAAADAKKTGDEFIALKTDLKEDLKETLCGLGTASASEKIPQSGTASKISVPDDASSNYAILNSIDPNVVKIICKSKQLISFDGISVNGSGLTGVFSNNKITLNGPWSGQSKRWGALSAPYVLKAGKTYTFSAQLISGTASHEINFNLCNASAATVIGIPVTNSKKSKSYTPSSDTTITQIGWGEYYGGATFTNAIYALLIEESSVATDYVDYEQYAYNNPQNGQIIKVAVGGDIEFIDSSESSADYDYQIIFFRETKTIVVGQNGDYTSLIDALNSVDSDTHYRIEIKEGTYMLSDEWTAEELSNANYPNGFYGTVVPSNCDLIGIGDREKIIITAEANDSYTWNDTWTHISTLNVKGGSTIENLTIKNKGMRYTIHHDFQAAKNKTTNYINCIIDKWGTEEGHAIGAASHDGETVNIENCIIKPAMGWHGHNPATAGATLNIKNTIINNLIQLTDYLTGYAMPVNMVNVKCNAIRYIKASSGSTQYMRINLHGCKCPIITTEDVVYDMDGVVRKMSNTDIAKGKAVKQSSYNTVLAMGTSDASSTFYGVTMEAIPKAQYNVSDYYSGRVITEGYISTNLLGLSGVSVGDKIGISNGSFVVVESDEIGIIDYVVDSVGYMRIL